MQQFSLALSCRLYKCSLVLVTDVAAAAWFKAVTPDAISGCTNLGIN